MKCYVELVKTPTVDSPGTLLFLHFDSRRYLIGNVSEGTSRSCTERGVGIRKVSTLMLTGRTEWANVGGLLGLVLNLADVKHAAKEAGAATIPSSKLDIYGPPNLNHLVASSRRFIFRTGMPMNIIEHHETERQNNEPTWQDEMVRVWTMSIRPRPLKTTKNSPSSPRKRSYAEMDGRAPHQAANTFGNDPNLELRQAVVSQMFNSSWRSDNLMPQKLSQVRLPAKIFIRDSETKQYVEYNGPLPGGTEPVPDITVWAREPWPGALTEHLPPTKPALDAVSYIIRNYPQRGKFLPEKASELLVPKGKLWSQLTSGITVQNTRGEDITPSMVLEPGREGRGFAVVDLPGVEYVEELIQRAEWKTPEIMVGVEAIVWILGTGVSSDYRLQQFQAEMSHLKHVVSSTDCCPNILAYEVAAANSLRHNRIADQFFPKLQFSPIHNQETDPNVLQTSAHAIVTQRGQILTLEPQVQLREDEVKPPLDLSSLQEKIMEEFKVLDKSVAESDTSNIQGELEQWRKSFQHADVEIIVLGTGSSHPSQCRNVSGTLVRVPGCGSYLLDCGEGTLGTLKRMFSSSELELILKDLKMIWISHLHADHHLGLASMIKAWSQVDSIDSSGPRLAVVSDAAMLYWLHEYGTAEDLGLERVLHLATTPSKRSRDNLEAKQGTKLRQITSPSAREDFSAASANEDETADYLKELNIESLNSVYVDHCRGAQAISIIFNSNLKVSYSGDCRPSLDFATIGLNSHVLIHEATFEDNMRNEALAKKHSTSGEAFSVACKMKARVCLLTHFSQRYPQMPRLGVSKRAIARDVPSVASVLASEGLLETAPATSMDENDGDGMVSQPLRPVKESSFVSFITTSPDNGTIHHDDTGSSSLLAGGTVQGSVEQDDIKVLFAFDYMRIKLGDIPILERKQPVLRQMYDLGIGKDMLKEPVEETLSDEVAAKDTEAVKQQKKKSKMDKFEQEKGGNTQRSKS